MLSAQSTAVHSISYIFVVQVRTYAARKVASAAATANSVFVAAAFSENEAKFPGSGRVR